MCVHVCVCDVGVLEGGGGDGTAGGIWGDDSWMVWGEVSGVKGTPATAYGVLS